MAMQIAVRCCEGGPRVPNGCLSMLEFRIKTRLYSAILLGLCCQQAAASGGASGAAAQFDADILAARGLPAELAESFKYSKRFLAGEQPVLLKVNGIRIGTLPARFDAQGELCASRELLGRANVVVPKDAGGDCIDLHALYPQALVHLRPGREEVELVLPPEAIGSLAEDPLLGMTTGGGAALFNYDLLYMRSNSAATTNSTLQASTELGFNYRDWSFRSRQTFSRSNGSSDFNHLDAYAQRSLPAWKRVLQVGKFNVSGAMFDAPPLLGAQLFPETALLDDAGSRAVVEGIAESEARVEVRQGGALIHSTLVPPGPFTLTGLQLTNANIDLEVKVIEAGGAQRSFVVPASSFAVGFVPRERSFSLALGKPWYYGGDDQSTRRAPWLVIGRADLPLGSRANLGVGGLLSPHYQALGAQYTVAVNRWLSGGIGQTVSFDKDSAGVGAQTTLNANVQFSEALSADASYSLQTDAYRGFQQASAERDGVPEDWSDPHDLAPRNGQRQASFNLQYRHPLLGAFGTGYSRYSAPGEADSHRSTLRWSKSGRRGSLSLSLDKLSGAREDLLVYATLTVPLGRSGSLNTGYARNDRRQALSASYQDRINEQVGYRLRMETSSQERTPSVAAHVALLPRYLQADLGISRYGSGNTLYTGRVSGGVVAHGDGVTLSPYAVRDTFALLSVPGTPGVRIQTPHGPVWTDAAGRAVAPFMPAYAPVRLEMSTRSLPRNVDVRNGLKVLGLGRGAVGKVDFDVVRTRRVLLRLLDQAGQPLPTGSSVFDPAGQWISSVTGDGMVFLDGQQLAAPLRVKLGGAMACEAKIALPEWAPADSYYENAEAVCVMEQ